MIADYLSLIKKISSNASSYYTPKNKIKSISQWLAKTSANDLVRTPRGSNPGPGPVQIVRRSLGHSTIEPILTIEYYNGID